MRAFFGQYGMMILYVTLGLAIIVAMYGITDTVIASEVIDEQAVMMEYGDINKVLKSNDNGTTFPTLHVANKHLAIGAAFDPADPEILVEARTSDGNVVTAINVVALADENNLASLKPGYVNVYGASEVDTSKAGRYEIVYILVDAKTKLRAEGDAVITII